MEPVQTCNRADVGVQALGLDGLEWMCSSVDQVDQGSVVPRVPATTAAMQMHHRLDKVELATICGVARFHVAPATFRDKLL